MKDYRALKRYSVVRPAWAITWWCKSTTRSVAGSVS